MFHQRKLRQLRKTLKLNNGKGHRKLRKQKSKTVINLKEKQKRCKKK